MQRKSNFYDLPKKIPGPNFFLLDPIFFRWTQSGPTVEFENKNPPHFGHFRHMDIRRANIWTDVDDFVLRQSYMSYDHTKYPFTTVGSLVLISQGVKGVKLTQVGGGYKIEKKNWAGSHKLRWCWVMLRSSGKVTNRPNSNKKAKKNTCAIEHNLLNIWDNAKIPREMERAWFFLPETLHCKFVLAILRDL